MSFTNELQAVRRIREWQLVRGIEKSPLEIAHDAREIARKFGCSILYAYEAMEHLMLTKERTEDQR